jgi:hypothetical protein
MNANSSFDESRRKFLKNSAMVAGVFAAPAILTSKRTAAQDVVGSGDHVFEAVHGWPQLPSPYTWQTTHNVAVDSEGLLYVIHEGRPELADHPSIFVFDSEGKFVRAFGAQFQGGGHGIEIRREGSEDFIYVAAYQQVKTIAKLTLQGEIIWQQYAPVVSGQYAKDEAVNPQRRWARDAFLPTNFAFLADGGFLLADGYGAFYIHRYDAQGNWLSCFGGAGEGKGTFNTPHGLAVDTRAGKEPEIVVTDRAHNTLQTFTMDGQYKSTIEGFGLPANAETHKDLMVIPELVARVSLLDTNHKVVATLGDDIERVIADRDANNGFVIRTREDMWQQGKFVHPHDACFDADGNIFVAEWVQTGRITRLKRV